MSSALLHELLARSAQRSPDAVAVVDGARAVTYAELDGWSSAIAGVLVERGVAPGDRVAIHLEKSIEAVAAIYGALKAGAVYVPFDQSSPPERLAYIAANASIRVACTSLGKLASLREMLTHEAPFETLLVLDGDVDADALADGLAGLDVADAAVVRAARGSAVPVRRVPEDLAYVLYTSGSTGRPKGVMLSHRAALGFVTWAVDAFGVTGADRLSSHAPFHFDLSIFDLFAASMAGAAVVLVPRAATRFPVEIRRFVDRERITVWYSVPSALSMLALRGGLERGALRSLRLVLFAGEVFPEDHRRALMELVPHAEYWNLYGPTETNVCTAYRVPSLEDDHGDAGALPIGRAIDGDETFVVTEDGRLARPGELGVLYVRGATVMSGYWGDPDRTAAVLAPSPLHAPAGEPAYCTGDLVRERADGNYEFLGRRDQQIKSRGYRIELGEIEAALVAVESVMEAAVVAVPDDLVGNRIHAFAAPATATEPELVAACKAHLPAYMVPDRLDVLEVLPKTSTGKIDRRALAERAAGSTSHATTGTRS